MNGVRLEVLVLVVVLGLALSDSTNQITSTSASTSSDDAAASTIESATPTIESATPTIESATPTIESATPTIESATPTIESAISTIESVTPTSETSTLDSPTSPLTTNDVTTDAATTTNPVDPVCNVTEVTSNSLTVTWTDIMDNFNVTVTPGSSCFNCNELNITVTQGHVSLRDLCPKVEYEISVYQGDELVSKCSDATSGKDEAPVPTNIQYEITSDSISASWTHPHCVKTNMFYRLACVEIHEDGSFGNHTNVDVDIQSVTLVAEAKNLKPYTPYQLRMSTCRKPFTDCKGDEKNVRTLAATPSPPEVSIENVTSSSLEVTWNKPSSPNGPIDGYLLYLDEQLLNNVSRSVTKYTFSDLKAYIVYTIKVEAFNVVNNNIALVSSPGVLVARTAMTGPEPPEDFTISGISASEVNLTWSEPKSWNGPASGFRLRWTDRNGVGIGDVKHSKETFNWTVVNLQAAREYVFHLTAYNNDTEEIFTSSAVTVSNMTYPAAPGKVTNFTLTVLSSRIITCAWNMPLEPERRGNIDGYFLYTNETHVKISNASETSFAFEDLSPWTSYNIFIQAFNVDPEGTVLGGTLENRTAQTMPSYPTAPLNLQTPEIGARKITLTWDEPAHPNGPLDGYLLSCKPISTQECNGTRVDQVTTSFTFGALQPFTKYTFFVRAFNKPSQEEESMLIGDEASISTTTHTEKPGPVLNLRVTGSTSTSLSLEWDKPKEQNGPIDGYSLSGNFTSQASDSTNRENYFVEGLLPYEVYRFTVSAYNIDGANLWTGTGVTISQRTDPSYPSAPASVDAVVVSAREMNISWTQPETANGPIDGYILSCQPNITEISPDQVLSPNLTSLELSNLKPFQNYTFTVWAFNYDIKSNESDIMEGNSSSTTQQTFTAEPSPPGSPAIRNATDHSIKVEWTKPTEPNGPVDGYLLDFVPETKDGVEYRGLETSSTVFEGRDLSPYMKYEIYVKAFNQDSQQPGKRLVSPSSKNLGTTDIAVPKTPTDFQVVDFNSRTLNIKWTAPHPVAGPTNYSMVLTGYPVYNGSCDQPTEINTIRNVSTTSTEYRFRDLEPYFCYESSLTAETRKGRSGNVTSGTVRTLADQPSQPLSLNITDDPYRERTIHISWIEPEFFNGPLNGYKIHFKLQNQDENVAYSERTSLELADLMPYSNYSISVAAYNVENGTELVGLTQTEIHQTAIATPEAPSNVVLQTLSSDSIYVNWTRPRLNPGPTKYTVSVQRLRNPVMIECDGESGDEVDFQGCTGLDDWRVDNCVITHLEPFKCYRVKVQATTVRGSRGSKISTAARTEAGVPDKPDKNMSSDTSASASSSSPPTQHNIVIPVSLFKEDRGPISDYVVLVAGKDEMETGASEGTQSISETKFRVWSSTNRTAMYRASPKGWNYNPGVNYQGSGLPCQSMGNGKGTKCTLGTQDCRELSGDDFCNGQLQPNTEYLVKIRAYTEGGYSETNPLPFRTAATYPGQDNDENSSPGAVIGAVVAVCLVVGLAAAAIFKFRDRIKHYLNPKPDVVPSPPAVAPVPSDRDGTCIKISDFPERLARLHADSELLFSQEYELLKRRSPVYTQDAANLPQNKSKNRFINILPFDRTRVKLQTADGQEDPVADYINANYVYNHNEKPEFIASQGPLPTTSADFWRMVWENKVSMIVMLTQCAERGKAKCEQYWPADVGESQRFGDIKVVLVSETMLSGYIIRLLSAQRGSEQRTIKQMFFTKWPDFGVPEVPELLINFAMAVRDHLPRKVEGPILAHCSAGVGRTGTYIAVDRLIQQIRSGQQYIDIFRTVQDLRTYRPNMVQTEDQYIFIYDCVKEIIQDEVSRKSKIYESNGCEKIYSNLQEMA